MGKKDFLRKLGIAGLVSAVLTGCDFIPNMNEEPCVYGPPPMEDVVISSETQEEIDPAFPQEDESFVPNENEIICLYGPPEIFEEDPEYKPEDNYPDEVYGPPPFEEEEDE